MYSRLHALLVTGLLLTMSTGCYPVIWSADSSEFIWTEVSPEQTVVFHYDLAKGQSRIVAKDIPAMSPWPGLSPDGKQIALARLTANPEKWETLQLIVYSLQGKEVQRSAELPWARGRTDDNKLLPTAVFWGPKDLLLVHDLGDAQEGRSKQTGKTGIYDLKKKSILVLDGCPMTVAGSPIRPDGQGFLMWRPAKNSLDVFFVLWDGTEHKIQMGPKTLDQRDMLQAPWRSASEWRGHVAVVGSGTDSVLIDTEKRTGTFAAIAGADANGSVLQRFTFPDGGAELRVTAVKEVSGQRRLELLKRGDKKPIVIVMGKPPGGHAPGDNFFLSPSPNRQWVAVRLYYDESQQGRVLLINNRGEVKDIKTKIK